MKNKTVNHHIKFWASSTRHWYCSAQLSPVMQLLQSGTVPAPVADGSDAVASFAAQLPAPVYAAGPSGLSGNSPNCCLFLSANSTLGNVQVPALRPVRCSRFLFRVLDSAACDRRRPKLNSGGTMSALALGEIKWGKTLVGGNIHCPFYN